MNAPEGMAARLASLADEWEREADEQAQWRGRGYAERLRAALASEATDPAPPTQEWCRICSRHVEAPENHDGAMHDAYVANSPPPDPAPEGDREALTEVLRKTQMRPYEDGKGGWLFRYATPDEQADAVLAAGFRRATDPPAGETV